MKSSTKNQFIKESMQLPAKDLLALMLEILNQRMEQLSGKDDEALYDCFKIYQDKEKIQNYSEILKVAAVDAKILAIKREAYAKKELLLYQFLQQLKDRYHVIHDLINVDTVKMEPFNCLCQLILVERMSSKLIVLNYNEQSSHQFKNNQIIEVANSELFEAIRDHTPVCVP